MQRSSTERLRRLRWMVSRIEAARQVRGRGEIRIGFVEKCFRFRVSRAQIAYGKRLNFG